MDKRKLSSYIDHTLLKPEATADQIDLLCAQARQHGFASVCVLPYWVRRSAQQLKESPVKVGTVVGFPLGGNTASIKVKESSQAVSDGAQEIDMVINIGALKSGSFDQVHKEIEAVVREVEGEVLVKVIIETALLNPEEKRVACQIAVAAGAHFVKTSTGFSGGGATVEDVRLIKEIVGERAGIKASGGIRTYSAAIGLIQAGATRLGTSSALAILEGAP